MMMHHSSLGQYVCVCVFVRVCVCARALLPEDSHQRQLFCHLARAIETHGLDTLL